MTRFSFKTITVIVRSQQIGWESLTFKGIRAHDELVDYAGNRLNRNKQIMVVEADGVCLYSRLSCEKDLTWADMADFFAVYQAIPFVGGAAV